MAGRAARHLFALCILPATMRSHRTQEQIAPFNKCKTNEAVFTEFSVRSRRDLNEKLYGPDGIASIDAHLKRNINSDIVYIAPQHHDVAAQYPDISFLLAPLNLMA